MESSFSATDTFVIIPAFGPWTVILLALAMIAYMVWYNRKRAIGEGVCSVLKDAVFPAAFSLPRS